MAKHDPSREEPEHPKSCRRRRLSRRRKVTDQLTEQTDSPRGRAVRRRRIKKTIEVEETYQNFPADLPFMSGSGAFFASSGGAIGCLPNRLKLEIRGTTDRQGNPLPQLDGDFILDVVCEDEGGRRWECDFKVKEGFFRAAATAVQKAADVLIVRATLEGMRRGPSWWGRCAHLEQPVQLKLRGAARGRIRWPKEVELTPLEMTMAAYTTMSSGQ